MKRFVFIAFAVLPLCIGSTAFAGGVGTGRRSGASFTGTTVFSSSAACSLFEQTFDASYVIATRRHGSVHLDGCVGAPSSLNPPLSFPYSGSFVLTAPNHATLTGSVSGVIGSGTAGGCTSGLPGPFQFTLVPTKGTKQLSHVRRGISMTGTWCSPGAPDVAGPVFGTLAVVP
jgi:hypothetical protein